MAESREKMDPVDPSRQPAKTDTTRVQAVKQVSEMEDLYAQRLEQFATVVRELRDDRSRRTFEEYDNQMNTAKGLWQLLENIAKKHSYIYELPIGKRAMGVLEELRTLIKEQVNELKEKEKFFQVQRDQERIADEILDLYAESKPPYNQRAGDRTKAGKQKQVVPGKQTK